MCLAKRYLDVGSLHFSDTVTKAAAEPQEIHKFGNSKNHIDSE